MLLETKKEPADQKGLPSYTFENMPGQLWRSRFDQMKNLIVGNWEVTNHLAGVRPAIADRKPVIGIHPEQPFTYIFGGLGAKGISLAPWCAIKLLDNLVNNEIPPTEIHVSRFKKRYQLLKASTNAKVLAT
jgi:hypothetical protein